MDKEPTVDTENSEASSVQIVSVRGRPVGITRSRL